MARQGCFSQEGDNNSAYDNIVYGNGFNIMSGHGIGVGGYGTDSTNAKIYNNTVYNNAVAGIRLGSPYQGPSNTLVRNNILYGNGTDSVMQDYDSGSVIDHNLIGTDPLFANADAGDFRLQSSSSALTAGEGGTQAGAGADSAGPAQCGTPSAAGGPNSGGSGSEENESEDLIMDQVKDFFGIGNDTD